MSTAQQAAAVLGLVALDADSLSPWSPVHRARTPDGREVLLKHAADRGRAEAMASWTRAAAAAGIPVVTPVPLEVANPQQIDDVAWVVYPFVHGEPYRGTAEQLAAAGDLLGRLHACSAPGTGLREYSWPDHDPDAVEADLAAIAEKTDNTAVRSVADHWQTALPRLRAADADLPRAVVSSDWKAANLVFTEAGPVLVDPENGGREPRLFDLALALTLWHHECPTAPPRMPTAEEWQIFATAYLARIDLTATERRLWPDALTHMLWEEGSWALEDNDADAWADPRQGGFLRDLAATTAERYPLP